MQSNTISVSPLPQGTTSQKIKSIFSPYSVKNVHIEGQTAYVEFNDEGDLQNLEIQFENYKVADLNNANIDKVNFDWTALANHHSLMGTSIDNLVIIQYCDQFLLGSKTEAEIRGLFQFLTSLNRIITRKREVILEITDAKQIEKIQAIFPNFNVPSFGFNTLITKADLKKINPKQFVSQWAYLHGIKQYTIQPSIEPTQKIQSKPQKELKASFEIPVQEQKKSQKVLHEDILPVLNKKTSMQMNFANEQSKIQQQKKVQQPIQEASTHQQLDFCTQIKISQIQEKFGYEAYERQAQAQRNKNQMEQQQKRRIEQEQQQRKASEEQNRRRLQEDQQQKWNMFEDQTYSQKKPQQSTANYALETGQQRYQKVAQVQVKPPIVEQLGYAVNQAKQQSANLLQSSLQKLRKSDQNSLGFGIFESKPEPLNQPQMRIEQPQQKNQNSFVNPASLGYRQQGPKELGQDLLNSSMQFIKSSFDKFSQQYKNSEFLKLFDLEHQTQVDADHQKPPAKSQSKLLKTLVTFTLLIWVILLLMQDTSESIAVNSEIQTPSIQTQQLVSADQVPTVIE